MRATNAGADDDTPHTWEELRALADSRAVGVVSPGTATLAAVGVPAEVRVPVRELRRTMDRVPKMYELDSSGKAPAKRAEYDTSSSEEEKPKGGRGGRGSDNRGTQGEAKSPAAVPHRSVDILGSAGAGSPANRSPARGRYGGRSPAVTVTDTRTLLERSLGIVAGEASHADKDASLLENALEATGATGKLRAMTNEEAKQDKLERSMYELAEIPTAVMGKLKRTVWSLPNLEVAQEYYRNKSVGSNGAKPAPVCSTMTGRTCFTSGLCLLGSHCDPFLEGTKSELDRFGLPISRYFKLLKFAGWLCVIAMIVSIPNFVLFREGGLFLDEDTDPFTHFEGGRYHDYAGVTQRPIQTATYIDVKRVTASLSLGNMLLLPENITTFTAFSTLGFSVPLSGFEIGLFVTLCVCAVAAVLLGAVVWLWKQTQASNARDTWNPFGTVTIEEYSVSVSGLPKFVTADELKYHLESVTREKVYEVVLAEDYRALSTMLQERNKLMIQLDLLDGRIQHIKHADRSKAVNWAMPEKTLNEEEMRVKAEYDKAMDIKPEEPLWVKQSRHLDDKRKILLQELNLLLHRMEGRHFAEHRVRSAEPESPVHGAFVIKPPIIAYVTFQTVSGRHSCLSLYPSGLLPYMFMHPSRKLRKHRLVVAPACAPASLAWEHIGTPAYMVKFMEAVFALLASVLILVPFVLIHAGRKLEYNGSGSSVGTDLCLGWHKSVTVQALGPVSVVIVNLLMGRILRVLSQFEGHYSNDDKELSIFKRLLILQFVNTSMITLISSSSFERLFGNHSNGLQDFSWGWYRDVGSDLLVIMWLHAILPLLPTAFAWLFRRAYWWARVRFHALRYKSQTEMNRDFEPTEFCLPERAALMTNALLLAIIFGSSMPLLYPSAAAVFFIRYWADKLVFFRGSALPSMYQARIMDVVVTWLLRAVVLNLMLACWMFSQDQFLEFDVVASIQRNLGVPSGQSDGSMAFGGRTLREMGDRLATGHIAPVLVFTLTLLFGLGILILVATGRAFVFLVSCGSHCGAKAGSDNVRIIQRRRAVEASIGSQCLIYGRKRRRLARVNNSETSMDFGRGRATSIFTSVEDVESLQDAKTVNQIAKGMMANVRFGQGKDGEPQVDENEYPDYLPLSDAIRRHKFVGLPSYHMIDNPVYREALPFGNQDVDLIRKHGLAVMARIRTVGGSPVRHKQVPMPVPVRY